MDLSSKREHGVLLERGTILQCLETLAHYEALILQHPLQLTDFLLEKMFRVDLLEPIEPLEPSKKLNLIN